MGLTSFGVLFLFCSCLALETIVPLAGDGWTFKSGNDSTKTGPAIVPGDIYTDLWKAGLIEDPIKNNHDIDYQWVGRSDWIYTKTVDLSNYSSLAPKSVWLRFDGLDTVASVSINGNFLFQSVNQFVDYNFNVKDRLVAGKNKIEVKFQSAVTSI
uniref:Beta-mannosidase n=1 Tax=Panagrolaimus sp. JU765 TaxID=591449 RepID=A0AC34RD05_9BILA